MFVIHSLCEVTLASLSLTIAVTHTRIHTHIQLTHTHRIKDTDPFHCLSAGVKIYLFSPQFCLSLSVYKLHLFLICVTTMVQIDLRGSPMSFPYLFSYLSEMVGSSNRSMRTATDISLFYFLLYLCENKTQNKRKKKTKII